MNSELMNREIKIEPDLDEEKGTTVTNNRLADYVVGRNLDVTVYNKPTSWEVI